MFSNFLARVQELIKVFLGEARYLSRLRLMEKSYPIPFSFLLALYSRDIPILFVLEFIKSFLYLKLLHGCNDLCVQSLNKLLYFWDHVILSDPRCKFGCLVKNRQCLVGTRQLNTNLLGFQVRCLVKNRQVSSRYQTV